MILLITAGCGTSDPGPGARDELDAGVESDPGDAGVDPEPSCTPTDEVADNSIDDDCDGLVDEIRVCPEGAPFATLAAAIAALPSGSALEVCAGTYPEPLVIDGKSFHIKGTAGAEATILDVAGAGRVIDVSAVGGDGVTLEGLTIRGGAADIGAGVRCTTSTLALIDSVVVANAASEDGGGLAAVSCALAIVHVSFEGNVVGAPDTAHEEPSGAAPEGGRGGGAYLEACSGEVSGARFVDNAALNGGGLASVEGSVAITASEFSDNFTPFRGGGVYHASDAPIDGNLIDGNRSVRHIGGGIYVREHAPTVSGNMVLGNHAKSDGGGVFVDKGSASLVDNLIAANETDDDGGGLRVFKATAHVEGNVIEGNLSADDGAGVRSSHMHSLFLDNVVRDNVAGGQGGGYDLDNDSSVVRGGEITGNTAVGAGGGIAAMLLPFDGGAIEDVVIADNVAGRGGGIAIEENYKPVAVRRVWLEGNSAVEGGGLIVRASRVTVANTFFIRNAASASGGAIAYDEAEPWEPDPSFDPPTRTSLGRIDFVTVHGNTAPLGAGIAIGTDGLAVANSILSGGAVSLGGGLDVDWETNDSFPASFSGMADPTGTFGNLAVDPGFVDAAGHDFHLSAGSACVDAADASLVDADDGSRADLGAYGGPSPP